MENSVIEVSNLTVKFQDFKAVDDISFSIKKGEIFGLLGANGAGKTTTIRVVCGLLLSTSGKVVVCKEELKKGTEDIIKSKVGYMSQKFTLYDDLTVDENLEFTACLRRIPKDTFLERKKELLDFINFEYKTKTLVANLPPGVKQQVSLIASMIHQPEVVFLDEPTAGVSPSYRKKFWELIQKVTKSGSTVIVTTHYMDEAENCEKIALMRSGKIIALDKPATLKKRSFPNDLYDLEPKKNSSLNLSSKLKKKISFIEPYGYHYHISIKDSSDWQEIRDELQKDFIITKIEASLEDVFIKLVEDT